MTQKQSRKKGNPDLRRQQQSPTLEIPQIHEELVKYLEPSLFTPLKYFQGNHEQIMRDRLLNLPVMVALIISLVYRQIAGLSEAVRVLKEEGLLWVPPLEVSKQALSKRLINLPAEIFAALLKSVLEKMAQTPQEFKIATPGQEVSKRFSVVWIADGSTLSSCTKD